MIPPARSVSRARRAWLHLSGSPPAARRRLFLAALALAALGAAACDDGRPRALILADGAGPGLAPWVDERASTFERSGRSVRVLRVGADDAINLASRGDADVALVPGEVPIDRFLSAQHGREAGRRNDGLRVLVVDARTHPKVDKEGADSLAQHLLD
ncbi:MAG: hypothetical protein WKG00_35140 [Polyangiaceae bacterium]